MFKLVKASKADISELVRISAAAFGSDTKLYAQADGGPPYYNDIAWHERMLAEGRLYTAKCGDHIIGGALLFVDAGSPWNMYIGRIFIDPIHFRKGYGTQLMHAVETLFPEVTAFTLDTPVWNERTNAFYIKLGYTETDRNTEEVRYTKSHYRL